MPPVGVGIGRRAISPQSKYPWLKNDIVIKIPSTKMMGWSESPSPYLFAYYGKAINLFFFSFSYFFTFHFSFKIICIPQSIKIETIKLYIITFIKFLLFHSIKIILTTLWVDSDHPIIFAKDYDHTVISVEGLLITMSFLSQGDFWAKGILIYRYTHWNISEESSIIYSSAKMVC